MRPSRFPLGQVVATRGALIAIPSEEIVVALRRHALADWGDVCAEDRAANDSALECGDRLLSVYGTDGDRQFWIITEWNRSVTTILLPEDY
jgi:hypothetical protein